MEFPKGRGFVDLDMDGPVPLVLLRVDYGFNERVKALPSRKWNKKKRAWEIKMVKSNLFPVLSWIEEGLLTVDPDIHKALLDRVAPKQKSEKRWWPSYYSFKTEPLKKQINAIEHCFTNDAWALPAEMGCGKSKISIDVVSALILEGLIDGAIIVSKVSLRDNWLDEIEKHCPLEGVDSISLASKPASVKKVENIKGPFFVSVGVDSLSGSLYKGQVFDALYNLVKNKRCALIVDESQHIKSHKSTRTKNIEALGGFCKYKGIMTGTPVPKNILDLYSQYHFLDPDILGYPSFFSFKLSHSVMGGFGGKQILGFRNTDSIMEKISPMTFRMYRKDVVDLPPLIRNALFVHMSPILAKAYKSMKHDHVVMSGDDIMYASGPEMISVYTKLRGITSGYIKDKDVVTWLETPKKTPKIKELVDILEATSEQAIVWCNTHAELNAIISTLGDDAVSYHGEIAPAERTEVISQFKAGKYRTLVATVQSMQLGLTLTEATLEVFFSLPLTYSDYTQAEARAYRIGQTKKTMVILMITEDSVDMDIVAAIMERKDLHDYVMEKQVGGRFIEMTKQHLDSIINSVVL